MIGGDYEKPRKAYSPGSIASFNGPLPSHIEKAGKYSRSRLYSSTANCRAATASSKYDCRSRADVADESPLFYFGAYSFQNWKNIALEVMIGAVSLVR